MGVRGWIGPGLLVAASLAIGLVAAELLVRGLMPQRLYYNISQWDPYVGFTMIPGIESVARHDEYTMHIRINSRGLRDREFSLAKPPGTLRVGVFGDSFTFGEGVEAEEAYPRVLEGLLAGSPHLPPGSQVQVLNFGIGKTGTSHQLAWYEQEGVLYDLDLVIVGFLSGNDFADNLGGVFVLRDGELEHNPQAYSSIRRIQRIVYSIPFYRWAAEHSHLVNLLRVAVTRLDDRRRLDIAWETAAADAAGGEPAIDLTLALFERFRARVVAAGGELLVVSLPSRGQQPAYAHGSDAGSRPAYETWVTQLQERLEAAAIPVLDLVPVFADLPVATHYYVIDGHMRPAGHEVIAETLAAPVARRLQRRLPATPVPPAPAAG